MEEIREEPSQLGLQSVLEKWLRGAIVDALKSPDVQFEIKRLMQEELESAMKKLISSSTPTGTMTVAEAAHYAGVAEATIRDWIKNNRLGAMKAGRRFRIKLSDLEESMAFDTVRCTRADIEKEAKKIVRLARQRSQKVN
jgi:excisionase family DNA binding protein